MSWVVFGWGISRSRSTGLLLWWLIGALLFGMLTSWRPDLADIRSRVRHLIGLHAILIVAAVATTYSAARQSTLAAHLRYQGVVLDGLDSVVIGTDSAADVRFPKAVEQTPWIIIARAGLSGWQIEPGVGVEQVRLIGKKHPIFGTTNTNIANAVILHRVGDAVVVERDSIAIDTIRLAEVGGEKVLRSSALGANLMLAPVASDVRGRYARSLRAGMSLSRLDGTRRSASSHERFVRVQRLRFNETFNRSEGGIGKERLLLSAARPYSLRAPSAEATLPVISDSATVEVRHMDGRWRFTLSRRFAAKDENTALAVGFIRNPRPLEVALPTRNTCHEGAGCGLLSLKRLPSPISHVSLGDVGLSADIYGLLAGTRADDRGITIVLPRQEIRVNRNGITAIPATRLHDSTGRAWVQLGASISAAAKVRDIIRIVLLPLVILALLWRLVPQVRGTGRVMALGLTAILALLLVRLIIGARVSFFPPEEPRGLQTALGLWIAIALVVVGLLKWNTWASPSLRNSRRLFQGELSGASTVVLLLRAIVTPALIIGFIGLVSAMLFGLEAAIAYVGIALRGAVAAGCVLFAWFSLAWMLAYSDAHFYTYDHPWDVIEHTTASRNITAESRSSRFLKWPEGVIACLIGAAGFGIIAGGWARVAGIMGVMLMGVIVMAISLLGLVLVRGSRRRVQHSSTYGLAFGLAVTATVFLLLRTFSENGATAAFTLVILVSLAGVRAGRTLRAEVYSGRAPGKQAFWREMVLLLFPTVILGVFLIPIDMGLFLVVALPVGAAVVLAASGARVSVKAVVFSLVVLAFLTYSVKRTLFPELSRLRGAESYVDETAAFRDLVPRLARALPIPRIQESADRAAVRALVAQDQRLAEATLLGVGPSPARDMLIPSIEQVWGAKAYASEGGLWGMGLGRAPVGTGGIAEAVSYAENSYAVFVLAEHGAFTGLALLFTYGLLLAAVGSAILAPSSYPLTDSDHASRALILVASLLIVVPATYVAMANIGRVPITGQNMPFLGLNAWSDVTLCAGCVGILLTATVHLVQRNELRSGAETL